MQVEPQEKHSPAISVVIPTLNRAAPLRDVLNYFLEDEPFRDFEIIIVDQSDELNQELVDLSQSMPDTLRYEFVDFRQTTRARNLGVELARAGLVVFSEDDVKPWPGLLKEYWKLFQDCNVQGATGPVLAPGQPVRTREQFSELELRLLHECRIMVLDGDFAFSARYGAGGNSAYRKAAIVHAGGFDERYVGNAWGEELEFGYRFRKKAGPIHYLPSAGVVHLAVPSGGSRNANRNIYIRDFVRNAIYTTWRIDSRSEQLVMEAWRSYRRLVLNKATFKRGNLLRGSLAFVSGLISVSNLIRECKKNSTIKETCSDR